VDKVPVSELCEELGLRPTVFYRWQKELFENGAAAFQLANWFPNLLSDSVKGAPIGFAVN